HVLKEHGRAISPSSHPERVAMGATSKVLAVAVIGLTVVGCGLARQAGREVAQRAADDSRCRSYGFKTDADLARCRMQLDLARLRRRSASGGGEVGGIPHTKYHFRCLHFGDATLPH